MIDGIICDSMVVAQKPVPSREAEFSMHWIVLMKAESFIRQMQRAYPLPRNLRGKVQFYIATDLLGKSIRAHYEHGNRDAYRYLAMVRDDEHKRLRYWDTIAIQE